MMKSISFSLTQTETFATKNKTYRFLAIRRVRNVNFLLYEWHFYYTINCCNTATFLIFQKYLLHSNNKTRRLIKISFGKV